MGKQFTHKLLIGYIHVNYPIVRMKDDNGHRFKRAVVFDGGLVLFLHNDQHYQALIVHLFRALKKVFYFKDEEIKGAMKDYFNLK